MVGSVTKKSTGLRILSRQNFVLRATEHNTTHISTICVKHNRSLTDNEVTQHVKRSTHTAGHDSGAAIDIGLKTQRTTSTPASQWCQWEFKVPSLSLSRFQRPEGVSTDYSTVNNKALGIATSCRPSATQGQSVSGGGCSGGSGGGGGGGGGGGSGGGGGGGSGGP